MRVDGEQDFHHFTVAEMRDWLNRKWGGLAWQGMTRVRIIHGRGVSLGLALKTWCEEKGIEWAPESGNPGATIIFPSHSHRPAQDPPNRPIAALLNPHRSRVQKLPASTIPRPEPSDSDLF